MCKYIAFLVSVGLWCFYANAQEIALDDALRETYVNCVGIDDALYDMKVKAGINTAAENTGKIRTNLTKKTIFIHVLKPLFYYDINPS